MPIHKPSLLATVAGAALKLLIVTFVLGYVYPQLVLALAHLR